MDRSAYHHQSKLDVLLGRDFWSHIQGKTVIHFGCGSGSDSIEMFRRGASHVVGLDSNTSRLDEARRRLRGDENIQFVTSTHIKADVIVSVDAFEHYGDPAKVLEQMAELLKPDGSIHISFGPTWYHPLGGHIFSVVPWAHLIFTEKALIRWRNDFRSDGATRFSEVEGGLNQMTIKRFKRLVEVSPFELAEFHTRPIRVVRSLANPLTREFLTATVRCVLTFKPVVKPG